MPTSEPKTQDPPQADGRLSAHERIRRLEDRLRAVTDIGSSFATSVGLDSLFVDIVPKVTRLMDAERTTLFLFHESAGEIWSKVAEGDGIRELRLSLGQGIAGWVAQHKQSVNIPEAYADPRFDGQIDAKTGFRTRSVAAAPLVDRKGQLVGVLQVLNHRAGAFDDDDMSMLETIAAHTVYAVENARFYQHILDQNQELEGARHRAERRRAEIDLLYRFERETANCRDLEALLDSVILRACQRLRSELGCVLLPGSDEDRLYVRQVRDDGEGELQTLLLEEERGIVGLVAEKGEAMVINRPGDDPRYKGELARKLNVEVEALLAVPLVCDKSVVGALGVANPVPLPTRSRGYDLEDLKVLTVIAGQVARAVTATLERRVELQQERLAAIGRMLAAVAHDLRNPMTVVSGYAQLMVQESDPQEREQACTKILDQIEAMASMIGDLLAFAKGDSRLRPSQVTVKSLADDLGAMVIPVCESRGVELKLQSDDGSAFIDCSKARRILFNLAENALDALGQGGRLEVDLHAANGGLGLRVSDTGPGIPERMRATIFEPFVSVGKANGIGLGLSIVKRFVEDHGGRIDVDSTAGEGATISVFLPRA